MERCWAVTQTRTSNWALCHRSRSTGQSLMASGRVPKVTRILRTRKIVRRAKYEFSRKIAHAAHDFVELRRGGRPAIVLFDELARGAAELLAGGGIAQEADHVECKIGRAVGQHDVFAVAHGQTFGTHGGGDDGFTHGHGFE